MILLNSMEPMNLLIICLLFFNVLFIGIALFLVYQLFKKNSSSSSKESLPEPEAPKSPVAEVLDREPLKYVCAFHPDCDPVGVCAICEAACCESCLREWEHLNFCSDHIKLYAAHKWEPITNERTTANSPEASSYIYEFKKNIWSQGVPSFIVTHYRIEIESDIVESYVQLFVKLEDKVALSSMILQKKGAQKLPSH